MAVIVRPYADVDAPAVAALLNEVEVHFGGPPLFGPHEVRGWMREIRDVDLDTRLAVTADGTAVGYGLVSVPADGGQQASLKGAVHPAWRGRGIGRDLLAWQLGRLDDLHHQIAPAADWTARAGAHRQDTAARRLLERVGFAPVRYWFGMEAQTPAAAADGALPDGLRVQSAADVDPAALYAAHLEAFAGHFGFEPHGMQEWTAQTISSIGFRPDLSRIVYGDEIVAYVLSFDDETLPESVYVGVVGTRPAWRGRGIASLLLAEVLAAAATAGKTTARLNVDATNPTGVIRIYERAGFVAVSQFVSYSRSLVMVAGPAGS
ncbi:GNAT family N-acetyltransferase [Plantactinospora mayteni]|uniref:N-acetyltransferase n=1 Tax=Plantactinospora mayteni TaxID=566021 RepID=A0ABQ4F4R9_9ACTN|nr:GNAT family N-acetyltransferase [Plantactinospora mayteni]GIH01893.1 N-acetyltransferase [Plantactinospora mayteni]